MYQSNMQLKANLDQVQFIDPERKPEQRNKNPDKKK